MGEAGGHYRLGTVEAAEALLRNIYVDLRTKLRRWSAVTHQTPQARMGYIGQHLTSVVTGHRGKKSGARGDDLMLEGGAVGEIKTCYRVDQLGRCNSCGAGVASIELKCTAILRTGEECGSEDIKRNDDSKWLLSPKDETELAASFRPKTYYFVLFDFADFENPLEINVRIYEVDPRSKGFAYCLVDYYYNIRSKSKSRAPFNLWPFSTKFLAMKPTLIYSARIGEDDSITTELFRGERGEPSLLAFGPLTDYSASTSLSEDAVRSLAKALGVSLSKGQKARATRSGAKVAMLAAIEEERRSIGLADEVLADRIADAIYGAAIKEHLAALPRGTPRPA